MSYLTKYSHATDKASTADMECYAASHDALAQGRLVATAGQTILKQADENLRDPWPK